MPLFPTFNRTNQYRWAPLYYNDCILLETFPDLFEEFVNGDFTVSRVNKNVVLFPLIKLRKRNLSKKKKKKCSIVAGSGVTWDKSSTEPKNKRKSTPPHHPKFLCFGKWNFLAQILKKFLMFSQRKAFHIFSQKKASLVFPKTEPCTFYSKPKNFKNPQEKDFSSPNIFLYLQKRNILALVLKKFLIFSQIKAFLIFQKTEPCTFQSNP